jgi:hypothetical protein
MKLVMFAGAGSVGKTSILESLEKEATAKNIKVATHRSSTRKTYANAGLTKESDALNNEAFNKVFQEQVFKDNSDDLLQAITKAKDSGIELFIADRTPYDYISYYFIVFQTSLTINTIKEKRALADGVMVSVESLLYTEPGHVIYLIELPFPAPWSEETESSDGWRADKTGKNFIWASLVANELKQTYTVPTIKVVGTPQEEAIKLLTVLGY